MAAPGFFGNPALSGRPSSEIPHAGRCAAAGDGDSSRRINFAEYKKYSDGIFRSDHMPGAYDGGTGNCKFSITEVLRKVWSGSVYRSYL